MVNFGPLTAEIGSGVWGIPANFNGFRVLPSLLHRRRSPEANQTLHDVWPSPGLAHYIYTFVDSCPLTEFCQVQNALCVQVLRFPILAALLHGTPAAGVSQALRRGTKIELRNFRRGRHLYSAGRPSRWASAHILVMAALRSRCGHYIFVLWFLLLSSIFLSIFFPRLISAVADWMSTILPHMVWP